MADYDDLDRSRDNAVSSRERDRMRRGDKQSRLKDRSRDRSVERGNDRGGNKSSNCRVYVSNISYEYRWQDLKDIFRKKVGDVAFVELFVDENDKPKGCGIVEFSDPSSVKKCMEIMHRFDLNGRKLVIKEDFGNERDKFGNIVNEKRNRYSRLMDKGDWDEIRDSSSSLLKLHRDSADISKWGNTFGLNAQFLESLNINRPLSTRVFVANLDYKVDEKKLYEVFKLCGRVINVELYHDKEGNSRGFAVIEYDHPVESVQAISMLHNQVLYDRQLTVRMDRIDESPHKLPEGLKGVGMGLGANGEPLKDVRYSLPSSTNYLTNGNLLTTNSGIGIMNALSNPTGLQQHASLMGTGLSTAAAAAALSGVVNTTSTLTNLGSSSTAGLQASLNTVPFLHGSSTLNSTFGNNLTNDLGVANFSAQSINNLKNSLSHNSSMASLANVNSTTSNNLMSRDRLGNTDRDFSRNDTTTSGSSPAFLLTGTNNKSQRNSYQNDSFDYQTSSNSVNAIHDYEPTSLRNYRVL